MLFNKINFYIENENLKNIIRNFLFDDDFLYEIHSFKNLNKNLNKNLKNENINLNEINIFIVNSFPEKIFPDAKYIFCFKNISELEIFNEKQLDFFYDLLSENLTPLLLKFHIKKILKNIKSEFESEHDFLTGLANRRLLEKYLRKIKNEKNITAIYFDLDNFKNFNDIYGHCEGDKILTDTAKMLKKEFQDDFCVRMGGDEFLVIILGFISCEKIQKKVDLFIKNLLKFFRSKNETENLSISAGFSQKINGEKKSTEKLIYESDQALYKAKKTGTSPVFE